MCECVKLLLSLHNSVIVLVWDILVLYAKSKRHVHVDAIPTSLFHMITVYGLIQPLAARNRIKVPSALLIYFRTGLISKFHLWSC